MSLPSEINRGSLEQHTARLVDDLEGPSPDTAKRETCPIMRSFTYVR